MQYMQVTILFGTIAKAAYKEVVLGLKGSPKQINSNTLFVNLVFQQGSQLVLGASLFIVV